MHKDPGAFNGIGVPIAATGLLHPVWAVAAMAVSVPPIFANPLWGRAQLLIQALLSVGGHHGPEADAEAPAAATEAA